MREHVARMTAEPCEWGVSDCSMFAARWVETVRGITLPLPAYRGEEAGRALIAKAGGLLNIWEHIADAADLRATDAPRYGDVMVFDTARFGPVGGIVVHGELVAWRGTNGMTFIHPRRPLKSWAV